MCLSRTPAPPSPRPPLARALVAATLAAALLASCGGDPDVTARDTLSAPVGQAQPATYGADAGTAAPDDGAAAEGECRMSGAWQTCSVVERLERAGFAPRPLQENVRQPGLAIAGTAYRLGQAELQLYVYPDGAAARRDADAIDADDARPAATAGILRAPAVIHSGNLVALLFNNNDRQLERVQLAITAGLPVR